MSDFSGTPEPKAARLLVEERLPAADGVDEILIVRSQERTVDPAFERHVVELASRADDFGIASISSYYETGDESLVSPDRDTTILPIVLADTADANVDRLVEAVTAQNGVGGFETYITGEFSTDHDFRMVAEEDLQWTTRSSSSPASASATTALATTRTPSPSAWARPGGSSPAPPGSWWRSSSASPPATSSCSSRWASGSPWPSSSTRRSCARRSSATMCLLGDRNWYLPRQLEWLPDVRVEPAEARTR